MNDKQTTPLDFDYDKYFLRNLTVIRSAISSFYFFDGEEAFNKEFNDFKEYVDNLIQRSDSLTKEVLKSKEKK